MIYLGFVIAYLMIGLVAALLIIKLEQEKEDYKYDNSYYWAVVLWPMGVIVLFIALCTITLERLNILKALSNWMQK